MKNNISIDIIVDEKYKETKVTINTNKKSEEIDSIVEAIKNVEDYKDLYISAQLKGKLELVSKNDILRIKRIGRQIILETEKQSFILKKTLSQLEQELDNRKFLRISQSEIINICKVKNLDVSVIGTILIEFDNGIKSNVSRRYVKKVKDFFKN